MHHLTLHLSEQNYKILLDKARATGLSIDAYIKTIIFDLDSGMFTPKEALSRARNKFEIGDIFELRDLYSQEEWHNRSRGEKIAFGRHFYTYIMEIEPGYVRLVPNSGRAGRRAQYLILK